VFDMVGNVWEWVGDWSDQANGCTHWSSGFGSDASCGSGASNLPGALVRGGLWYDGPNAGVFAVLSLNLPSNSFKDVGFRCAR
jgi:formylglycine-generating enzyme required for sulfatase activity